MQVNKVTRKDDNDIDQGWTQNLYRSRQRSIISDDSTIVGTAELENMPFSRIQGRLKLSGLPLYPTLIDTVLNSKTNVKDGEKKSF